MKRGRIILGAAALVVSACSGLSFKLALKFNTHRLHVQIKNDEDIYSNCITCIGGYFKAIGARITHCTIGIYEDFGKIIRIGTYYTAYTPLRHKKCLNEVSRWTSSL